MVRNPFSLARGAVPSDGLGGHRTIPMSSPSLGLAAPPSGQLSADVIKTAARSCGDLPPIWAEPAKLAEPYALKVPACTAAPLPPTTGECATRPSRRMTLLSL